MSIGKHVVASVAIALLVAPAWAQTGGAASTTVKWEPIGLSGGGSMYRPSFHPLDKQFMMINSDMSCVFISRNGGQTWDMIHQSQLMSSTSCYAGYHPTDANTIFAAQNGGGMRVTHDKGITWKQVEGLPKKPLASGSAELQFRNLRGEIRIDPDTGDRMMAGDDTDVFISQDGGKSWAKCDGPTGVSLAFHFDRNSSAGQRVIYAATSAGIWRSQDGGKSWKQLPSPVEGCKLASFSGGSDAKAKTLMLYASIESKGDKAPGALFRSSDGGRTWRSIINETIAKGSKVMQFPYVFTSDLNPRIVVAFNVGMGKMPMDNTAWRSDDAGDTWRSVLSMDYHEKGLTVTGHDYWSRAYGQYWTWEPRGVAFDYSNPDRLMRSQSNLILTEDSKTWHYANTSMAKDGEPKKGPLPTWNCNGLVVTTAWNYYVDPFKPNRRYIGYTDIGFAISDDNDKTWAFVQPRVPSGPNGGNNTTYELAFEPKTEGKIWGAFSGTHDIPGGNVIQGGHKDDWGGLVAVSTDYGDTWTKSNTGLPDKGVISIVMDPKSPVGNRTLYCSVWKNGVYKSVDDGKTWAKASDGLGDSAHPEYMYPCRIVLHEDGTLFVLLTGRKIENRYYIDKGPGLYRSTDGAKTWQLINKSGFLYWPCDFSVNPADSKVIYMGANSARDADQGGLYATTDGGEKWSRVAKIGREHFGAYFHPKRKGWIYMTCFNRDGGLYLSKDNGKTFTQFKGLPFGGPTRVCFDPTNEDVIYVTTFGGSVWRGPVSE